MADSKLLKYLSAYLSRTRAFRTACNKYNFHLINLLIQANCEFLLVTLVKCLDFTLGFDPQVKVDGMFLEQVQDFYLLSLVKKVLRYQEFNNDLAWSWGKVTHFTRNLRQNHITIQVSHANYQFSLELIYDASL